MRRLFTIVAASAAVPGAAHQVVPPAAYGGYSTQPPVTANPTPGMPALTAIPLATMAERFRIDPSYARTGRERITVIGAYAVAKRPGARLVDAWAPGYLPVTLAYDDGRCFTLDAAYEGRGLSNARLVPATCDRQRGSQERVMPAAPPGLRPVGETWGFGVWRGPRKGMTMIGAPFAKTFTPLVVARFPAMAVMAMNSPDAPLADLSFVGILDGQVTVVTVELAY